MSSASMRKMALLMAVLPAEDRRALEIVVPAALQKELSALTSACRARFGLPKRGSPNLVRWLFVQPESPDAWFVSERAAPIPDEEDRLAELTQSMDEWIGERVRSVMSGGSPESVTPATRQMLVSLVSELSTSSSRHAGNGRP